MAEVTGTEQLTRVYKDISLSFSRNPVNGDIVSLTGAEAIKRSVRNILMTQAGETPFLPKFGSRLRYLLFEPIDPITTALLQDEILTSISAYEPRARVQALVVHPDEPNNKYQINITLQLVNQVEPITFTIILSRIR